MRAAAFVLATLAAASAQAGGLRTDDQWTGPDKTKHEIAGFVIGASVTLATEKPLLGWAAGTAVGLLKELSDSRHPGTHDASFQDFAVTSMGAAVGAYAGGLIVTHYRGKTTVAIQRTF